MQKKGCDGVLRASDWILEREELESKFSERTKMIIVNTPHNPLGKVFSKEELQFIADLCIKWDVLCLMDEVYEWLVFEPYQHYRMGKQDG